MEVQKVWAKFQELPGTVAGISFAQPAIAWETAKKMQLSFPLLSDPEKSFYRYFNLASANWGNFLRPEVLLGYLSRIVQGWMPLKPRQGDDIFQLGGDFILNGAGETVFAFRSETPVHRPNNRVLLKEFATAVNKEK